MELSCPTGIQTVPEDGSVAWKCAAAGNDIIMPGNAEMPKVFAKHTETEILQKKKSVPVQAGFLN